MNFRFYLTIISLFIVLSYNAFSQLNADFSTYTPTSGCSPLNITFKDQSTGSIISRKWIFGNGNSTSSGNQTSPSAFYGDPNTYTVTLIISDGTNFDTIIKTNYITVYNDPVANFSNTTALSGCNPLSVGFQDNSTGQDGAITYWSWDFGDGYNSTEQDPVHTYIDYGSFPVSLYVIDEHGCYDTKLIENYVNVSQSPEPDFVANDTNQCVVPFDVTFTNLSTSAGSLTYSWNFGDGNTSTVANPSNTFDNFGLYDITLFASDENGCSNTIVKNDYITILDAVANFNTIKTIYCIDEEITFNNTSIGCTQYFWDFGDGVTDTAKNPIHSYSNWGDYNVKLISFIENSVCSDTIIKTITVERIEAAFTLDPARYCELSVTVNFTDQSINAVSWEWDFGWSSLSTVENPIRLTSGLQNPQIIFSKTIFDTNPYYFSRDITLTAISQNGCESTLIIDSALIVTIPKILLINDSMYGCVPLNVNFYDLSTYNSSFDVLATRLWDFDDGDSSDLQQVLHTFSDSGTYNVYLTINTSLGCVYQDSVKIFVGTKQNANFLVPTDTTCASDGVQFFDNSTDSTLINHWDWSFSNDSNYMTTNIRNPLIFFTDTGFFNISLTVGFNGCKDTLEIDSAIYVKGPYGRIMQTFECSSPLNYYFNPLIIDADNLFWDFNDGLTDSVQVNPVHTYSSGNYNVRLELYNNITSCTFIDSTDYISVRNLKSIVLSDTSYGCPGLTVKFIPDSTRDNDEFRYPDISPYLYKNYLWNYDDGSTFPITQEYQFTDSSVYHTFTEKGIYHTSLIVEDINGCRDTAYKTITIYLPQPDFSTAFESGCKPFNVNFTNNTPYDTTISAWHWNFGNGDTSNIQNPTTTYSEYGSYNVMLSVTNVLGCTSYITKPGFISVQTSSPSFTVIDSTLCENDTVFFINTTPGDSLNYLWDFGNGITSAEKNPTYFYPDSGSYDVSLKVIDTVGCDTIFIKYNYIIKQKIPIADFVAGNLTAECYPKIISFNDSSGTPYSSIWNWDFGDEATSTLQNPIHSYTRPGQFDVELFVSTSFGCKDSITKENFVTVQGPYAEFSFSNPNVCADVPFAFYIDTMIDVDIFEWDFGDGIRVIGTGDTIYHTYSPLDYGSLHPQLSFSDADSTCPQLRRDSLFINVVITSFFVNDSVLCSGSSLSFINSSFGDMLYDWDFGDGFNSVIENPTHSYSSPGNYTVYLTASDQYSCSDVDSLAVTIHPLPNYLAINDTIKCDYDTITLDAGVGFTSYLWSDNSTLQTLNVTNQGQITVKVKNTEGCWSAKDTIVVTDIPTPDVDFGDDKLICEDTTIFLYVNWSSYNTYLWNTGSTNNWIFANPLNTYSLLDSNRCGIDRDTIYLDMIPLPSVNLGVDTAICNGTNLMLYATGSQYDSYVWNDFSTSDSLIADTIRTYSVIVYNSCDTVSDSKMIDLIPIPQVSLIDDTICEGTTLTLFAPFSIYHNYLWNTGDTIDSITALPDSLYYVKISNDCGVDSDSVFIEKIPLPVVNLGVDTAICNGTTLSLFATGSQYDSYLWNDNSTLDSLIADTIKTYSVTVSNTCDTATASIAIDLIPIPQVSLIDDTICEGTTITLFTPFSIYHNYIWNTGDTIDSITALPDSLYYVKISNYCGVDSDSVFIEKIPLPIVNLGVDTAICNGTTLTLFATGSEYDSYIWNDSTTLDSLVADTIKTYFVKVSNSCNIANDSIAIDLIPIPQVSLIDDTICEGTTLSLFAPFSIYHNYLWNTGDTIDSITALPDSLYYVKISNACGRDSDSVFIEKIPLPVVNLGVDTAICNGTTLTLFATGSQYDSYLWNDSTTLDSLIADTIKTYSVTVSNTCDTASASIAIDLIPIPQVSLIDDTICEGTTITLFAPFSIYHNYLWNTGDTIDSITVLPDSLYYVKISNACGTDSDSVFIEKIPLPVVNLGVDTAICNGTTLTLFATGSEYDSYLWSDNSTLDSLVADTIKTYFVKVSNSCNTANDSIAIDLIPIPQVSLIDDTICEGTTITLFAQFSIYHNYLWNTGDTIDSITVLPDSLYYVKISNTCGTDSDSVFIEKIPLPVVNLGVDTAICNGTTLTLFATGSEYDSYLWNDSTKLDSIIADTIKTYFVKVTNLCSEVTDSIAIDIIPIPNVDFGNDTSICEGTTLVLNAGESIYNTYIWNNDSTTQTQTTDTISYFSVTVTTEKCGSSNDSINIGLKPNPVISFGNDTTFCESSNILIDWISGYSNYYWSDGSTEQNLTINLSDTVSLQVRDSVGCFSNIDTIAIKAVSPAVINLGNDKTICSGDSLLLAANSGYNYYSWSNGSKNDSIYISLTGTYFAQVINTCDTAYDTLNLFVYNEIIELGLDTIMCIPETITLDAGIGFESYLWSDNSLTQTLTIDKAGKYYVSVTAVTTDSVECKFISDTVNVSYLPNTVNLGPDTAMCEGSIITFSTPDNFDTLTWHNGFHYPAFTTSKPGTYYLSATNKCGTFSDTVVLVINQYPLVELGPDIAVSNKPETLDAGEDANTYLWSTGDTTRTIQVTQGDYAVWVEVAKNGCKSSDTISILNSPENSGCIFGVPNAFTPNGDNKNDILFVRGYCIEEVEFMVFNRFGEMVFKSENINEGWDGKYKGRLQESEVYIWYLKVKLTDGQTIEKTGNVGLIN